MGYCIHPPQGGVLIKMKKVLSAILVLIMLLSMIPFCAWADCTCGDAQVLEPLEEIAPTCTTEGRTGGTKCTTCGETVEAGTTLPATGHKAADGSGTIKTTATCTAMGTTTYICQTCGNPFDVEDIPASGHSWGAPDPTTGICTCQNGCGETKQTWKVTFYNGDTTVDVKTVDNGSLVSPPDNPPTKTGYNLTWYADSGLINPFYFETTQITADTDVFAKFTPITYTVKFDGNKGKGSTDPENVRAELTAEYDKPFTLNKPTDKPNRIGYIFVGWSTDPNAKTGETTFINLIDHSGEVTLYAIWRPITITVVFKIEYPSGIIITEKQEYEFDNPGSLKSFSDYYAFEDWKNEYGERYKDKAIFDPTEYYNSHHKTEVTLSGKLEDRSYTVKLKTYIYHKVEKEDEETGKIKTVWTYDDGIDYEGKAGNIYYLSIGYFGDTQIIGGVTSSQLASYLVNLSFVPKDGYYVDKARLDCKLNNIKNMPLKRDGATLTTELVPKSVKAEIVVRVYFKPGTSKAPLTGDDFNTWMAIAGISLIGATGTGIMYKKRRKEE